MILAPERVRGALTPTASYDRREYAWEPEDRFSPDPRDGTLTILLTHTGKRIARTTIHEYAVSVEWEAAVDSGVASFLLENVREPDVDGPIRCVVGGTVETCTCEHGRFAAARGVSAECKHVAALAAVIKKGAI